MIRLKQKNLPGLLRQILCEKAREIDLPSRQQLWTELQQRPEFAAIEKNAKQLPLQLKRRKSTVINLYTFFRKHLHLAGLVAACLLLAVLLSRPALLMKQTGSREPHLQEQISAPEMGSQSQNTAGDRGGRDADAAIIFSDKKDENGENASMENFSLRGGGKQMLSVRDVEEALEKEDDTQPPGALGLYSLQAEETPAAEKHPRDPQPDRNNRSAPAEQTSSFEDEDSFHRALKDLRQLTAEEIWQVSSLPDGFSFEEGTITRTGETLLQITQVFAKKQEEGFTLTQQFMQEEAKNRAGTDPDPAITQSPAQPMQVGPYRGYLFRPSPELCTLTWLQEESSVTISGQLTEEMLHQTLNALVPLPGD